jgi:UDP-N-acetylglucosamine/UDP-N-acetylgalactosamine diphosphorylase
MFERFEAAPLQQSYRAQGESLIKEGKVAALLLAGGQGTRLGSQYSSKGFYPVSLIKKRTLFEIFAGKVLAASKRYGRPLLLAIMTSPLNHDEIIAYFRENRFFGLEESQVSFFMQPLLPFLGERGEVLEEKGPCGNGVAIRELFASGIGPSWKRAGIEYFTTILVDNPLADPYLTELVGFHGARDMSALVTRRRDLLEKVGILIKEQGRVRICEYSEFPEEEWPHHHFANLSQFCFSLVFAEQHKDAELPLHIARKASYFKREYFIIDFVQLANDFHALEYPRAHCFAPLKNSEGDDSIGSVQKALQERDRLHWRELFSVDPENISFELSPQFYYPQAELLAHFSGRMPQENSYIEYRQP